MPSAPSVAPTMSNSSSPPGYLRLAFSSPLDGLSATGIPSSLPSMRKSALQKVVPLAQSCPRGGRQFARQGAQLRDFSHELGVRPFQPTDDVVDPDLPPVDLSAGEVGERGHDDGS